MDLSLKDRVILANQYRIRAVLDEEESEHWAKLAEIVEHGYKGQYYQFSNWFYDELPVDECNEVSDVLQMFRSFDTANRDLKDHGIDPQKLVFNGFDGNDESKYLVYLQFLIDKEDKWTEHKGRDLNSHAPMMDRYRKMVEKWKTSADKYRLNADDLKRITA